ncbi:MAG: hydrogenase nickel incorporation protein HypB [Clostridia bacterium]
MNKKIDVVENILDENDRIAVKTQEKLSENGVFCINVMGAPGVGKTSVMKGIAARAQFKPYVIEGDIESDIDTAALRAIGIETVQINTHGACHLDAPSIDSVISDEMKNGVLFIENIGNLVCPAEFNIGEHAKMLIVSVTDGSDKPYKYPLAFLKADIIVLNKCDLESHLDFDYDFFYKGVMLQNKNAVVVRVSSKTGEGIEDVVKWIENARA